MQTLEIGTARIDSVEESRVLFDPTMTVGATPRTVLDHFDLLGPRLVDRETGKLKLAIQSFLIRTPDRTILVDTCCGNGRDRPSAPFAHMLDSSFLQNLEALGVKPESIDLVRCTHLHVDHIGWNMRQDVNGWRPTFPNAEYRICGPEYEWWVHTLAKGGGSPHARVSFRECVAPIVAAGLARFVDADHVVEDSADLRIWFEELPGHTMHQCGIKVRSGGAEAFIVADAVHHAVQFSFPNWISQVHTDEPLARKTLHSLIDRYTDAPTIILTSHSPGPCSARLVKQDGRSCLRFLDEL